MCGGVDRRVGFVVVLSLAGRAKAILLFKTMWARVTMELWIEEGDIANLVANAPQFGSTFCLRMSVMWSNWGSN